MPESADIASNKLIQQTTSQNIKKIDKYLKHLPNNKYKAIISKVLKSNNLRADNRAMNAFDKIASKNVRNATVKKQPNLAYDEDLAKSSNYLLLRFDNQYLNKIAKSHHSFRMPQMELNHMMSATSMKRPSKFVATDTIVDNQSGQNQFMDEERTKVNHLQKLQATPDYFQNNLKQSIMGVTDDYYHQKLENNFYKKLLKKNINPTDQDYIVGIDGSANQQPHIKDGYQAGLTNLHNLAPAVKAFANEPSGKKARYHFNANIDKEYKDEKTILENNYGIPKNKMPSMTFKEKIAGQLRGLKNFAQNHPWELGITPNKAFIKYPNAMKILGMSDQHYYKDASKQEHINQNTTIANGVYPISSPEESFLDNAHTDIVTPKKLIAHINNFQESTMSDLDSSDLKDIENGNDDNMYGTTSPNFKETDYKVASKKQNRNIKLNKYQEAIKTNQITPQKYGNFFDKNPKIGKFTHILSGNQAQKKIKKQINKESHWMATSNINEPLSNVKTVANMEKTDKHILKQIQPNRAYTSEQISNIGNSPKSKVESLGKRAMEQNVQTFLANDKYEAHKQQHRNNFFDNHFQVQGIGFGSKEKDKHVAKNIKNHIFKEAGLRNPSSIKPSDIHHNINKDKHLRVNKKSRNKKQNIKKQKEQRFKSSGPSIH